MFAFILMLIFRVVDLGFIKKPIEIHETPSKQPRIQKDSSSVIIDSNDFDTIKSQDTMDKKSEITQKKEENKITITDSPGSIATINQKGDNVIINPQISIPPPKFSINYISRNVPIDTLYKTELLLIINSAVQINNLYLEARAQSIVEFSANAQRTGLVQIGHTGTRNGWAFTNIPNAWGRWKLIILTEHIEDNIIIGYNY